MPVSSPLWDASELISFSTNVGITHPNKPKTTRTNRIRFSFMVITHHHYSIILAHGKSATRTSVIPIGTSSTDSTGRDSRGTGL